MAFGNPVLSCYEEFIFVGRGASVAFAIVESFRVVSAPELKPLIGYPSTRRTVPEAIVPAGSRRMLVQTDKPFQ